MVSAGVTKGLDIDGPQLSKWTLNTITNVLVRKKADTQEKTM